MFVHGLKCEDLRERTPAKLVLGPELDFVDCVVLKTHHCVPTLCTRPENYTGFSRGYVKKEIDILSFCPALQIQYR